MSATFVDLVLAYLAIDANRASFAAATSLADFAGASFGRRYGQGGFQVDGVTLGPLTDYAPQRLIVDDVRVTGSKEYHGARTERQMVDYRVRGQAQFGWVDASLTAAASFALHAVPGTLLIGPGGQVVEAGDEPAPPPALRRLNFGVGVATEAFTLDYTLELYLFVAAEPSPSADLRRILGLRQHLESDPGFLATLDGPPGQRPYLFAQIYPDTDPGGGLTKVATAAFFNAADVLAAFLKPPVP